jgi:hypothetical protein
MANTKHFTPSPSASLLSARDDYFATNGFGADGGYADAWVDFKLGPIPFPFPNTAGRVAAVRFHDLHHVLTGYATDFLGELEISAWEIGAGCKRNLFAWQINLGGLGGGMLLAPRRTARAFFRGLASQTLYGAAYEPLLERSVAAVQQELKLDIPPALPGPLGWLSLLLATLVGIALGLFQFAVLLPLVPVGLFMNVLRRSPRLTSRVQ